MTVKIENDTSSLEGGKVVCRSCIAHGRIMLELLGKPSSVQQRLESLAHAHDTGVHRDKGDIKVTLYYSPQAE